MVISVSSPYHTLEEQPIFHKGIGGTTVALLRGLCMLQQSAQALCPLPRDSTNPGIPKARPSALPNQVFFPQRTSHSLWNVWKSREMKANEVKYSHSTPSHSQAAQGQVLGMGCRFSSKLARAGSPFPHWNTHDLSALGERSITTSLHLGQHCQIERLGRSHFTRGKHLHSETA